MQFLTVVHASLFSVRLCQLRCNYLVFQTLRSLVFSVLVTFERRLLASFLVHTNKIPAYHDQYHDQYHSS